ncbi:unnamed protein product, partial [Closterium sp. NIES-65]
ARKHNNAVHFIGPSECRQFFFHMGVAFESMRSPLVHLKKFWSATTTVAYSTSPTLPLPLIIVLPPTFPPTFPSVDSKAVLVDSLSLLAFPATAPLPLSLFLRFPPLPPSLSLSSCVSRHCPPLSLSSCVSRHCPPSLSLSLAFFRHCPPPSLSLLAFPATATPPSLSLLAFPATAPPLSLSRLRFPPLPPPSLSLLAFPATAPLPLSLFLRFPPLPPPSLSLLRFPPLPPSLSLSLQCLLEWLCAFFPLSLPNTIPTPPSLCRPACPAFPTHCIPLPLTASLYSDPCELTAQLACSTLQVGAVGFPPPSHPLPARCPSIGPPLEPTQCSSAGVGTHIALMSYAALVDWCLFLHAVFDSAMFGGDKDTQDLVLLPSYVDVTIMGWYTFAGCWLQWVEPPCVSGVKPETAKALRKRGIQPRFRVQSLCQPRRCLNSSWSDPGLCVFDNNFSLTPGRPFFKFKTGDKCPSTMHYGFYRGWEEEAQTEPVQFLAVHFMHRKKEFLSTKFPPEPEKSWGSASE